MNEKFQDLTFVMEKRLQNVEHEPGKTMTLFMWWAADTKRYIASNIFLSFCKNEV